MDEILRAEYPFRFINGPLSLITLASAELSLSLWRQKTSTRGPTTISSLLEQPFSCTEFFTVPSRIKGLIDEKIISMGENLQKWVKFYSKFNSDMKSVFSTNFNDIVCDSTGEISYGKTGAKALQRDNIDDKMKLRIACMFCLEDEIKKIWPKVVTNWEFIKCHMFEKSMPFHYWSHLMTSNEDPVSIEKRLMTSYRRRNWAALRYFCRILKDESRLPKVLEIFKTNDTDAMMCLLPELTESEAQTVFEAKACEILTILLSNHEYVEHVLALWTHMENVISKDVFLQLIRGLWKLTWNIERRDRMSRFNLDGILMEIWTRAPDHLKTYVLNRHSDEFFYNLKHHSPGFAYNYGHDMGFLLEVLRKNNLEFRKSIWESNWRKIVLRSKPSYLEQFTALCFTDDDELKRFKFTKMVDFRLFYTLLIKQGFYSDLKDYLNFVWIVPDIVNVKAREIIKSNLATVTAGLIDDRKFHNFDIFFNGLFTNAADVGQIKRNLFLSAPGSKALFNVAIQSHPNNCKRIVSRLLSCEKDVENLKVKFLEYSRQYLIVRQNNDFSAPIFDELIKWCTKDEVEFAAYKDSLDINNIFQTHLYLYAFSSWVSGSKHSGIGRGLFFFDNFAKWYFSDDQAIRNFKLNRIDNYKSIPAICDMVLTSGSTITILRMLRWFYDKDAEKVAAFQERMEEDGFEPPMY